MLQSCRCKLPWLDGICAESYPRLWSGLHNGPCWTASFKPSTKNLLKTPNRLRMFYKFLKGFLEESKKTCKKIRTRPNAYRFSPLNFNRSTKFWLTTSLSYEALHRHFCKTTVTSWRSVVRVVKVRYDKGFAVIVQWVFWSLCVGCAVAVLKIFEGKEILKNNFSWVGKVEALLQTLVCGSACSGLQMCLHLYIGFVIC